MLELLTPRGGRLCDRISRRKLLEVGGLSLIGLGLPDVLRADAALAAEGQLRRTRGGRKRARSCIIVFLNGGPSHHDMWDMKPNAPAEVRGEFKPVSTPVDGIQLSEHLPRLAKLAPEFALLR